MAQKNVECYIDVWRDAGFRGEKMRIEGPAEYASLEFAEGSWGDDIGSLRVGPNAFVMAYHHRNFQDQLVTFGPNDEVADLSQFRSDDEFDSMKVIDSLKIFDRLAYNSVLTTEAPAAEPEGVRISETAGKSPHNPNKGRRWKGKKH